MDYDLKMNSLFEKTKPKEALLQATTDIYFKNNLK